MLNWHDFWIEPEPGKRPPEPRSLQTREGIGDRLRAVAFAELQAREGFRWAAETFANAPVSLRQAWSGLARAENKHLEWLYQRIREMNFSLKERPVSDWLWKSFMACENSREFSIYMANAEERGKEAGERFEQRLEKIDPVTSRLFGQISREEKEHIELARRYFN